MTKESTQDYVKRIVSGRVWFLREIPVLYRGVVQVSSAQLPIDEIRAASKSGYLK